MSDIFALNFLKHLNVMIEYTQILIRQYEDFLETLKNEEMAVMNHDISFYEENGKTKEISATKILDYVRKLLESCSDIHDMAISHEVDVKQVNKLSDMNMVLSAVEGKLSNGKGYKGQYFKEIIKARSLISDLVQMQHHVKEYTERNVILVNKLLNNHRQSYQFWRESIAEEAVGYNEKGVRSSKQSVSMFNARA